MKKPRRHKMREPAHSAELVEKIIQGLGLDERFNQYKALIIWNEVVGPQIAARTRPVRIRENILEVNVDQPTWMQQLQLMKPKILARLNQQLDKTTIKDIYLKRGKVNVHPDKPVEPPPAWRMVNLNDEEKRQVNDLLDAVEDSELKDEMAKFLEKQMRLIKATGADQQTTKG